MTDIIFDQFRLAGEDLARHRLTTTHGGNMSMRHQGRIAITAHFSRPGRLLPEDLIEIPLRGEPDGAAGASWDAPLHQLIYKITPAMAIIHAHPAHAVALSLNRDLILPQDTEGSVLLGEIPVVAADEAAALLPQALRRSAAAIIRGHGSYAAGQTLDEALAFTAALAFSCEVALLAAGISEPDE